MTDKEFKDIMAMAHVVNMCICNKYYVEAKKYIDKLAKKNVTFDLNDKEYLEWLAKQ